MKKNRLFAAAASMAMIASVMSVVPMGAGAANDAYTNATNKTDWGDAATAHTTVIKKILEIENTANIPSAGFTINATVPNAKVDATASTMAVYPGVNPELIKWKTDNASSATAGSSGTITYAPQDKADAANTSAGDFVTITDLTDDAATTDKDESDYYLASKNISLDFSDCVFTEPGIYRYYLDETNGGQSGISYDSTTRTLDVYVEHDAENSTATANKLKITDFVLYKGKITAGPSNTTPLGTTTEQVMEDTTKVAANTTNIVADGQKSVGFKNDYDTSDLTIGKQVTGNQGSKDKYFKFTVNISGAKKGTVYTVDYSTADVGNADVSIAADPNAATTVITSAVTQPESLTVGEDGTLTQNFYLQDGQYFTIKGLAKDTEFYVTEDKEDYTSTASAAGTGAITIGNITFDEAPGTAAAKNKVVSTDFQVAYKNDKTGTIPTGILLSVAGPAVVGAVTLGGISYLLLKNKKRDDEEE